MNVFFKMLLCTMLLATFVACNDDDDVKDAILEVNYKNLNGTWRLSEWNGKEMNEELYCYITFDRKEHTYIMYQNLNSMYSRKLTGSFLIEEKEDGFILSGTYDFGKGDWANKYIVTEMLDNSMKWIVKDNQEDISVYVRCEKVPDDILTRTRSLK